MVTTINIAAVYEEIGMTDETWLILYWSRFQVKPILAKMNEDTDFDVRYYASEASVGMYQNVTNTINGSLL